MISLFMDVPKKNIGTVISCVSEAPRTWIEIEFGKQKIPAEHSIFRIYYFWSRNSDWSSEDYWLVCDWPIPKNPDHVREFISLCGYYRTFVKDFAKFAKPFNALLEGGTNKKKPTSRTCNLTMKPPWNRKPFEELKLRLISQPILSCPNYLEPCILHVDNCGDGLGAVMCQIQNKREKSHCLCQKGTYLLGQFLSSGLDQVYYKPGLNYAKTGVFLNDGFFKSGLKVNLVQTVVYIYKPSFVKHAMTPWRHAMISPLRQKYVTTSKGSARRQKHVMAPENSSWRQ